MSEQTKSGIDITELVNVLKTALYLNDELIMKCTDDLCAINLKSHQEYEDKVKKILDYLT